MRKIRLTIAACLMLVPFVANAQKTKLHIRSATDTEAVQALINKFEEQNPDIDVIYREYNSNDLYNDILSNRENASYPVDIVISSAMDLQVKLVNEGLAASPLVTAPDNHPSWARWRGELFGFTYEPAAIAYHKPSFDGVELPQTHSQLASLIRDEHSFFHSRIGTYDIREAGVGYLFATQDAIQSSESFRLTESLGRANALTYCCSSKILDEISSGKLVLGYNLIGSYALARAKEDPNVGVLFLKDYTFVMARTAFIHRLSRQKEAAVLYLNFLLSTEGQRSIALNSSLIPIDKSAQYALEPHRAGSRFLPIKLGTGLLAYLDRLKKEKFLENWETSIRWEE